MKYMEGDLVICKVTSIVKTTVFVEDVSFSYQKIEFEYRTSPDDTWNLGKNQ